jgi:hypothetical protein
VISTKDECVVVLREKGGTQPRQPVSPTLMRHLVSHAAERGVPANGPLFRHQNGSRWGRRYNYIWRRVGEHLPCPAAKGVTGRPGQRSRLPT